MFGIPFRPGAFWFPILEHALLSSSSVTDGISSFLSCTIWKVQLGCCGNSFNTIFCHNVGHVWEHFCSLFSRIMTTSYCLLHLLLFTSLKRVIQYWLGMALVIGRRAPLKIVFIQYNVAYLADRNMFPFRRIRVCGAFTRYCCDTDCDGASPNFLSFFFCTVSIIGCLT